MKNKIFHTQDLCSGTNLICAKNCAEMENYMKTEIITSDVLIIGGTSLNVYPAAGLINYYQGHKLVLINRSSVSREVDAALVITDPIGEVLAQL